MFVPFPRLHRISLSLSQYKLYERCEGQSSCDEIWQNSVNAYRHVVWIVSVAFMFSWKPLAHQKITVPIIAKSLHEERHGMGEKP